MKKELNEDLEIRIGRKVQVKEGTYYLYTTPYSEGTVEEIMDLPPISILHIRFYKLTCGEELIGVIGGPSIFSLPTNHIIVIE